MNENNNEINYLDSFSADTAVVPDVIDKLLKHLAKMKLPDEEIDEIILTMDEAITNAIQETIQKQENFQSHDEEEAREITIRYSITDKDFNATIIDHGKGLDILKFTKKTPDKDSGSYYDEIENYVSEAEKKKLKVRLNGHEITLKGIGAGLKIILAFMDSVNIDLIDRQKVLSDCISNFTDGTILNLKRHRRY